MSTTALTPQVPPMRRLTTVGVAMLLVLAALTLLEVFNAMVPGAGTSAPSWHVAGALPTAPRAEAIASGVWRSASWLTHATWTFAIIALLLAIAQRSLHDLALAGAGALWALVFELDGRSARAVDTVPGAPDVGLQVVVIGALALSLWYGLRLLRRSGLQPHPLPLTRLLTLSGTAALILGLNGTLKQPAYWVLPLASVLACCGALVRMVDMARRPGSMLRPSVAAWLLALSVACLIAAVCRELWVQAAEPHAADTLREAWVATRGAVVLVLVCTLGLRLDQLARMLRQLGSSHQHWRRRLREVQRQLAQARERLVFADRTETQQHRRDQLLREVHDELGHRLLAALSATGAGANALDQEHARHHLDGSLLDLRLAYDALGVVPRPLAEAMQRLHEQLAPLLEDAGLQLRWTVDPSAATLVLDQAETLQLLRIVRGALTRSLERADHNGELRGICKLMLDVADGETGCHLRLRLGDEPVQASGRTATLGADWIRLQRQATSLGAQLALDPQAGPWRNGWSIELVMPLAGRQPAGGCVSMKLWRWDSLSTSRTRCGCSSRQASCGKRKSR